MSMLSKDVGNHAAPHTLCLDGDTWEFRLFSLVELVEFEKRNYARFKDELRKDRQDYSQERYEQELDRLRADYEKHHFALEYDIDRWSKDLTAFALIMMILTKRSEEECLRAVTYHAPEILDMMKLIFEESFKKVPKAGK